MTHYEDSIDFAWDLIGDLQHGSCYMLRNCDRTVLSRFLPELHACIGVKQNVNYHKLDVFDHSLEVVRNIPIGGNGKNWPWLRLAALLHDIGKPPTRSIRPDGQPQFLGHEDVGAEMFEGIWKRLHLGEIKGVYLPFDRIQALIRNHMFTCHEDSSPRTMRKTLAKVTRPNLFPQLRLRIGDHASKGYPVDLQKWIRLAKKLRLLRHMPKGPFQVKDLAIDGNDVMRVIGIPAGAEVGRTLNLIYTQVMNNEIPNIRGTLMDALMALKGHRSMVDELGKRMVP